MCLTDITTSDACYIQARSLQLKGLTSKEANLFLENIYIQTSYLFPFSMYVSVSSKLLIISTGFWYITLNKINNSIKKRNSIQINQ